LKLLKYIYKYWKKEALIIALGAITIPLTLLNPYIMKLILDKAYVNRDVRLFFIFAAISGIIFTLNSLIRFFAEYLSEFINRKVNFDMTNDLFRHLQNLPLKFFKNKSTGEHIFKINNDIVFVADFICEAFPRFIILPFRLIVTLIILFYLNWKIALFVTFFAPLTFISPYFFGKHLNEIMRFMIKRSQNVFQLIHEILSHMHIVKALGKEKYETDRVKRKSETKTDFQLWMAKISNLSRFSDSMISKGAAGLVLIYGGYQVIKGSMTLGSLAAIMIYLTQLVNVFSLLGRFYERFKVSLVSQRRIQEVLEKEPEIKDAVDARDHKILDGRIDFKNVKFAYEKTNFVLNNTNFSMPGNAKAAIVGSSGCGKTTLISLILKLYNLLQGKILIDGVSIDKIKLSSLKSQIGVALQEPFLWNDTVLNNILYGAQDDNKKDGVIYAAKISEAHDFITKLPKGYDTIIGESACKISEGQKQRIALARAVIKKPKILILDEALSSVDSDNEDKIMENIKKEFKNSTLIIISHRLSTVRKMDIVYFLDDKYVVETGNHKELLEKNPKYRNLFASQVNTNYAAKC